eukprot:gnl/TRDRNA2_/TRDRNA2_172946_c0_seq1.p1 gnl/TRDRNA2_/TRDRNA2_172946_c0~~gnl/TRDRNA2_/TRDRNA2_172946_c0_seq1.p1  ORF type:complete len:879 (-),score=130.51 gnl/TRDRNA2_/TRDRNA2_172946_c0_seq1:274-2910(-)
MEVTNSEDLKENLLVNGVVDLDAIASVGTIERWSDERFGADDNPKFARSAQTAARAAFAVTFLSFVYIFPHDEFPSLSNIQLNYLDINAASLTAFFFFSLGNDVGSTIASARDVTMGTAVACFCSYILFGLFPDGVNADSYPGTAMVGYVYGGLFMFAMIFLNLPNKMTVFALKVFTADFLAFLDPGKVHYSSGFRELFHSLHLHTMLVCIAGNAVALAVMLLPYPLFGITRARKASTKVADKLCRVWEFTVNSYCEQGVLNYIAHDLNYCEREGKAMASFIGDSWWECLGFGPTNNSRLILQKFWALTQREHRKLNVLIDAFEMENSMDADDERDGHKQFMDAVRVQCMNVVNKSNSMLKTCIKAGYDGKIDQSEVPSLLAAQEDLKQAITSLTKAFKVTKTERQSGDSMVRLNETNIDEHAFCFSVCSYGHSLIKFSNSVIGFCKETTNEDSEIQHAGSLQQDNALTESISDMFLNVLYKWVDPKELWSPHNIKESRRFGVALFLALLIGLGFTPFPKVFKPYDPAIAGALSIVISPALGSALQDNLMKIQGMVVGTIMGQLIDTVFGWCSLWTACCKAAMMLMFVWVSLFIHYDGVVFNKVGMLLAIFGCKVMIVNCKDSDPADYVLPAESTHHGLFIVVVAIVLLFLVDFMFASKTAAEHCLEVYKNFWVSATQELRSLFDPNVSTTATHAKYNELKSTLEKAQKLGVEANLEPRYRFIPFHKHLFDLAIKIGERYQSNVGFMQDSAAESQYHGPKARSFMELLNIESFKQIGDLLVDDMETLKPLLNIFGQQTEKRIAELKDKTAKTQFLVKFKSIMMEFMDNFHDMEPSLNPAETEFETLLDDPASKVSIVILAALNMVQSIKKLRVHIHKT